MARRTVTIACKLPAGLILQLQEPYSRTENVQGVMRDVQYWRFVGQKVRIRGCAFRADLGPQDRRIVGGYALTYGVDYDFWEAWARQNADNDAVVNSFVFAHVRPKEAEAQARDRKDELSGFEPINPAKMPDEFKRTIETAEVDP